MVSVDQEGVKKRVSCCALVSILGKVDEILSIVAISDGDDMVL